MRDKRVFIYLFIFINIKWLIGQAGRVDTRQNMRHPLSVRNPKKNKILIHIRPNMARGRTDGRAGRPVLTDRSGLVDICPPLCKRAKSER